MTTARNRTLPALAVIAAICLLPALTGCRKGPPRDEMQSILQSKLDDSFREGLFKVTSFSRRGHYPYTTEEDERDHVLVYYDAEIEFAQDHTLSDWDQLNVGSLIDVLGATPLGVKGVKADGNRQGDVLAVHGAIPFARDGDAWKLSRFTGSGEKRSEPAPSDMRDLPYRQKLEQISALGRRLHSKTDDGDHRFLTNELEKVRAAAQRRLWAREGILMISTGSTTGEYYRQGSQLAEVVSESWIEARAISSGGSIENCRLVERREVQFAYAQNDIAHMAFHGKGLFERQLPLRHLRALTTLYPEAVQVVTLQKSGISAIADLQGKRVDVGVDGSGSRINAVEVLGSAGIGLRDLGAAQGKLPHEALNDLKAGRVDAVILTSAFPNPVVRDLAQEEPISLVSITDESMDNLRQRSPFIISLQLPEKIYPGMDQGCTTAGVTATLITHESTEDEMVSTLMEKLFSNLERISEGSPQAYLISAKRAKTGLSIPLHPAAERWLEGKSR